MMPNNIERRIKKWRKAKNHGSFVQSKTKPKRQAGPKKHLEFNPACTKLEIPANMEHPPV